MYKFFSHKRTSCAQVAYSSTAGFSYNSAVEESRYLYACLTRLFHTFFLRFFGFFYQLLSTFTRYPHSLLLKLQLIYIER